MGLVSIVRDKTSLYRAATLTLLALGFGALIAGFLSTSIWSSRPTEMTEDLIRFTIITAVISLILRFVLPVRYANSVLLVWFAYHVLLVGIVPVLSALLVTAAAVGVGSLLLPKRIPCRLAFAVISGLGVTQREARTSHVEQHAHRGSKQPSGIDSHAACGSS